MSSDSTRLRWAFDLRGFPRWEQVLMIPRCLQCTRSKIQFQDHNMPLSWENVELRGFEPLTFCMPYKSLSFRNVARCGPTSSFNRWKSLAMARYRRLLASLLLP